MKFTKKIILSSVLFLGLLSQVAIGSAEESVGQLTVKLTGSDLNGALTLDSVADLSGQININGNNNTIAPLTKTGDIEITDTRPQNVANLWHLSVKVNQPTERGTGAFLGASGISYDINVNGNANLAPANPPSVLGNSTKVLTGKYSAVIPETAITSQLTIGEAFSSKAKGVYQNTIIYTLTEDVPATNPNAPITDGTPVAGEMIQFAGTDWRILKVEGNNALVIKENALTNEESGGIGDEVANVPFHDQINNNNDDEKTKYFSSQSDDGYSRSNLKTVIDSYYSSKIALDYSDYVLDVKVPNPTFSDLSDSSVDWTVPNDWSSWNSYGQSYEHQKENRWPTTYGEGSQQAFALSSSDIIYYGLNENEWNSTLLSFPSSNATTFMLRSAGGNFNSQSLVGNGGIGYSGYVNYSYPVRPALWLSLNN